MIIGVTAKPWQRAYAGLLAWPRLLLTLLLILCAAAGYYAQQFRFDASSDTLVVENDPDLLAYERITKTFSGDDFLLLTFEPSDGAPFTPANLNTLRELTAALNSVSGVTGTFSVLDIPLLQSPRLPLSELARGLPTLNSPAVALELAAAELNASPMFRELLISKNGRGTAIQINLASSAEATNAPLTAAQRRSEREQYLQSRANLIAAVRLVQTSYAHHGQLYLGGVPMIAADMIDYVRKDLQVFGASVIVLMMLALYGFFRRARWVLLPLVTSALTVLITVGWLGLLDKPATVISSNFIALLAIFTISLTIHLIVHYRELLHSNPQQSHPERVMQTMVGKFAPCLYTSVTTIAAFGSLLASRIVPVEDFGAMMCLGIAVGFVVTFLFFPAALLLIGAGQPSVTLGQAMAITRTLGHWSRWRSSLLILLSMLLAVIAGRGLMLLSLDNRFVDYFAQDTQIHQGMRHIDEQLGGTIPFDVVLTLPSYEPLNDSEDEDDLFAVDLAEDSAQELGDDRGANDSFPERYWFTRDKLDALERMHRFLERQPMIGKVRSLTSLEDLARGFTAGRKRNNLEIVGVLAAIPESIRAALVDEYADPQSGQLRLNVRIHESGPAFDRAELVAQIRTFATDELGMVAEDVTVSGMMVLFDSMLTQLFDSQIDTLGFVLLAVMLMLLVLLRSLTYALIGLVPNLLAAALVLATLGYFGIPLDMMTTTIAAISIGIGVDDAIHYLHRFKTEFAKWGDARVAVSWSHASIGNAMYFTTITVMLGFSVMVFSNFVPTVLFGLLVAIAMALALFANLTLLPSLLVWVYGKPVQKTDEFGG